MSQPLILAQAAPPPPSTAPAPEATTATQSVIVTSALGTDQSTQDGPPIWTNIVPLVLLLAFFYFAILRPGQKTKEAQETLLKKLKQGDKAVTSGGILGVVTGFEDNDTVVVLKVAENTKLRVRRTNISEILTDEVKAKESASTTTVMKDKEPSQNNNNSKDKRLPRN